MLFSIVKTVIIVSKAIFIRFFHLTILVTVASDECILEETGTTSLCIELLNCDYAKELLRQNKFPQTCGFNGKEPKVCCPIGAKTRLNEQPGDFAKRGKINF